MKRTILVILMLAMVATPCFAQEIEPDGLFSIDGTLWSVIIIGFQIPPPLILPYQYLVGFHQGTVYGCNMSSGKCNPSPSGTYIDLLLVSIALDSLFNEYTKDFGVWVMQPIGFGIYTGFSFSRGKRAFDWWASSSIGIMFKIDNDWTPPAGIISYISPNQGEQGTTLTDVQITCLDTTLQDDPPVLIRFNPSDGLTVSNINVISNTEIEFDLEIAVDTPLGYRSFSVIYDGGYQAIVGNIAFEVLPRSN